MQRSLQNPSIWQIFFEATTAICNKPKKVSNWLMVETMRLMKEHSMEAEDLKFSPVNLAKLIELNDAGTVNSSVAKRSI